MKALIVPVLLLSLASLASGAQYLTVNNQSVESIDLLVGQSCTFEVVSDNNDTYIGYWVYGLSQGTLTLLEIRPEAGSDAQATDWSAPGECCYEITADGSDPAPSAGVHFVFKFEALQPGDVGLWLHNADCSVTLDCVSVIVTEPKVDSNFTYQGRLLDGNNVAEGEYDFQFKLFNAIENGTQTGSTIDINEVDVINGYFTVELDFGTNVFTNKKRWIEIGIRPGELDDPCEYTILSPRQEITPVPFAIQARGIYVDDNYNVGIGTYSPQKKLHVVGTVKANELCLGADCRTSWPVGGDSSWVVSGNNIYSSVSGNVGIGTSNPGDKLHVYQPSSPAYAKVESDSSLAYFKADGSGNSGLLMVESGVTKAGIYWDAIDDYLSLNESSDDRLVVKGGKVGIGTTTPAKELHVAGDIRLDAYGDISFANDFTRIIENSGNLWIQANDEINLGPDDDIRMDADTLFVDSSANRVGIGTTSPSHKLHVAGNSYITGLIGLGAEPNTIAKLNISTAYEHAAYLTNTKSTSTAYGIKAETIGSGGSVHYGGRFSAMNASNYNYGIYSHASGGANNWAGYFSGDVCVTSELCVGTNDPESYTMRVNGTLGVEGAVEIRGMGTTSSGDNVIITNNRLYREFSSAKYKDNIQPLDDDFSKILAVQPRSFIDKTTKQRAIGLIAEELDELGLNKLVGYNKENQPETVRYTRVCLYLLEVLKDQATTTEQLKAENNLLNQRLDALEKMIPQQQFRQSKGGRQ
ncbi:MAG: tail fiber domain-containing protein [Planctomycetota bacterium]